MASLFQSAADRIRKSAFVLPFSMVFLVMFMLGIRFSIEDFGTSYMAYITWPSLKIGADIPYWASLLPYVAQLGFGYLFAENPRENWWAGVAAGFALLMDGGADVWYKTASFSMPLGVIVVTCAETLLFYTVGSEVFFTVGLGMSIKLLPDTIREMRSLGNSFSAIASSLLSSNVEERREQTRRNEPQVERRPVDLDRIIAEARRNEERQRELALAERERDRQGGKGQGKGKGGQRVPPPPPFTPDEERLYH